jgi:chromosome segregation ATPase
MRKNALAVMSLLASSALCQTPAKEPDTLQSLLTEVHQLRQGIEALTVASQRVQIALYALQMQDAAVARAAQRLDNVRNKCSGAEVGRERVASEMQSIESRLAAGTPPEANAKAVQLALPQLKREVEAKTLEVQACQVAEADAASQLRSDQAKLADLQDRIERLDKTLEKLGGAGK